MADALKLKENLQTNVVKILTLHKRAGTYPETDYTTKQPTGRNIILYVFRDAEGKEYKTYANEIEEQTLGAFNPGEQVAVVRVEKVKEDGKRIYFLQWGAPDSAEMTAAPQMKTNTAMKTETKKQDAYEQRQEEKDCSISLIAFAKSWIESGKADTPEKADELARRQYRLHTRSVEIMMEEAKSDPTTFGDMYNS